MGPSRRHTRSAGISSGTGVQNGPGRLTPYPTLPYYLLSWQYVFIMIIVTHEAQKMKTLILWNV